MPVLMNLTAAAWALPSLASPVACRVPGAQDAAAFWENLLAGREALTRLEADSAATASVDSGLEHHVPAGFLLADADCFDAGFFSMSPREAALTDPQRVARISQRRIRESDGATRWGDLTTGY